jgi:hypothetical protein
MHCWTYLRSWTRCGVPSHGAGYFAPASMVCAAQRRACCNLSLAASGRNYPGPPSSSCVFCTSLFLFVPRLLAWGSFLPRGYFATAWMPALTLEPFSSGERRRQGRRSQLATAIRFNP